MDLSPAIGGINHVGASDADAVAGLGEGDIGMEAGTGGAGVRLAREVVTDDFGDEMELTMGDIHQVDDGRVVRIEGDVRVAVRVDVDGDHASLDSGAGFNHA